jgi:endoribonuclease Dicer
VNFRNSHLNCLFATSVAEEGLDVTDCNIVIRFDLYSTLIQYIQSRGRARKENSRYIHMIEQNNRIHEAIIRDVFEAEAVLRKFCQTLPEERLIRGCDFDMEHVLAREKHQRSWSDPKTGAKLNYKISLTILANFVAALPQAPESYQAPDYVITVQNNQFLCEVILPENSPVQRAIGRPASTKQVAKCSAAFEACLLLRKGKFLDEYFIPIYTKQLPVMRNALLAVDSKKQAAYNMRIKPELWFVDEVPTQLFLTVLLLRDSGSLGRSSQPLALLTRSALPKISNIPLFPEPDHRVEVECIPLSVVLPVDRATLDKINVFTLRIFEDIFSKKYEPNPARMSYFLAPINPTILAAGILLPTELIAWDILGNVHQHETLLWDKTTPESFFEDRYITDPWDGSRKLWAIKVTHDYKPLDPVPPNTAPRSAKKRTDNILEYSCSLFEKARQRRTFSIDQPVIEAELIPLRRNLLDDIETVPDVPKRCFIVLEPLNISAVCCPILRVGYLLTI